MAYFGIDLGTAQTLIARYTKQYRSREQNNPFELIPIYYENYRYDEIRGEYCSNKTPDGNYMDSSLIMPSVLYLDERTKADGRTRTYRLVGEAAAWRVSQLDDYGGKYYTNAKAKLESDCRPDDNGITAGDVAYELLKTCFSSIREYIMKDSNLPPGAIERRMENTKIGVSTPLATNTEFSRVLFEQARRAAADTGFRGTDENIQLIEEPTAALVNYIMSVTRANRAGEANEIIGGTDDVRAAMVIDLGGGTTDVAVRPFSIKQNNNQTVIDFKDECLAKSGETIRCADNAKAAFGGMDFDDRIAAYLVLRFNQAYIKAGREPFCYEMSGYFDGDMHLRSEIADGVKKRIKSYASRLARMVKEAFTDTALEEYKLPDIYYLKSNEDRFSFSITITREEYVDLIRPLLENEAARRFLPGHQSETIEHIVSRTAANARLRHLSDLDFVYLTGGTSQMPEVRSWVEKYIGDSCPIIWANDRRASEGTLENCLTDIANGVALWLDKSIWGKEYEPRLSNAVMIDTQNGLPKVLIPAGTKYPESGTLENVFSVESVVGIGIRLYSAPDEYSADLRILGEYRMHRGRIIPPNTMLSFRYVLDGEKQISLTAFYVDESGRENEAKLDLKRLE